MDQTFRFIFLQTQVEKGMIVRAPNEIGFVYEKVSFRLKYKVAGFIKLTEIFKNIVIATNLCNLVLFAGISDTL